MYVYDFMNITGFGSHNIQLITLNGDITGFESHYSPGYSNGYNKIWIPLYSTIIYYYEDLSGLG